MTSDSPNPSRLAALSPRRQLGLVAALVLLTLTMTTSTRWSPADAQSGGEAHVLVFKPGDAAATEGKAGPVLRKLEGFMAKQIPAFAGRTVKAHIVNKPDAALRVLKDKKPALVIAPPSFAFAHLGDKATPVAQIPRFGAKGDKLYLVTAKKGGAADAKALAGKTVAVPFGFDARYLTRVGGLPADVKIQSSANLADELFGMTEGGGGPDAALLDEELKAFFEKDDLVWPAVQVVWSSSALPWTAVLAVGDWSADDRAGLLKGLQAMKGDAAGAEVLKLLKSSGIEAINQSSYDAARKRYGR